MSRSIKSLKKLKSMVGKEVKVCTSDSIVGICLVTEDKRGDICLISKDTSLSHASYFWKINSMDRDSIKNCTAEYVAGHYCCVAYHLTQELKWVTSSVPSKKPVVKADEKSNVKAEAKPVKETDEEFILEPKSVEELFAKAPCKVRLSDGQIGYAEKEKGRDKHATVFFNGTVNNAGWSTSYMGYKRGWYVNDTEDFENIFVKKAEETRKTTRDDAFRPLNIEQLKENIPCHVLLKDDQIGYAKLDGGVPVVYFNEQVNDDIGWYANEEGFNYGWNINDEEDFEDIFEVFGNKLAQSAEPVEPSLQEVTKEILDTLNDIKKDILETLKEIKNEIAKR